MSLQKSQKIARVYFENAIMAQSHHDKSTQVERQAE